MSKTLFCLNQTQTEYSIQFWAMYFQRCNNEIRLFLRAEWVGWEKNVKTMLSKEASKELGNASVRKLLKMSFPSTKRSSLKEI